MSWPSLKEIGGKDILTKMSQDNLTKMSHDIMRTCPRRVLCPVLCPLSTEVASISWHPVIGMCRHWYQKQRQKHCLCPHWNWQRHWHLHQQCQHWVSITRHWHPPQRHCHCPCPRQHLHWKHQHQQILASSASPASTLAEESSESASTSYQHGLSSMLSPAH